MSTVRKIGKNTLIVFFGNNITKLLSLFIVIFLARFLGDVDFGKFSFAV